MQDQLGSFPLETVAPVLLKCLQESSTNPNMAVYASRIVAWLADIAPQASCQALVQHGVVGALCARLMDIEFIDVAEACIDALSKLSLHVPETCLKQVYIRIVMFCTSCFLWLESLITKSLSEVFITE
jgi:E3 ubiquitin-protein ligase TRIP12